MFSHGIEFGIAQAGTRDLQEATITGLKAVAQNNPELKLAGDQQQLKISQRTAIGTPLVNPSPLGGQELIGLYTTFLADGTLFYYLTVVPRKGRREFPGDLQAHRRVDPPHRRTLRVSDGES